LERLSLSITNTLGVLSKWNLSTEELFVTQLLFLSSAEEQHKELLIEYYNNVKTATPLGDILLSLQNKGIITKEYKIPKKGQKFDPETLIFNKNFLAGYLKYSCELGIELFNVYPHFVNINGLTYDIANYAKKFNSEEEFCFAYGKAIGWNPNKHKQVIELVKWAKDNTDFLKGNICDFVISKAWLRIEELKNGDFDSLSFDNTTIL